MQQHQKQHYGTRVSSNCFSCRFNGGLVFPRTSGGISFSLRLYTTRSAEAVRAATQRLYENEYNDDDDDDDADDDDNDYNEKTYSPRPASRAFSTGVGTRLPATRKVGGSVHFQEPSNCLRRPLRSTVWRFSRYLPLYVGAG